MTNNYLLLIVQIGGLNPAYSVYFTEYGRYYNYEFMFFYCCTVHVVTIISFIPTHAQFYTL
jgi:hypothetical protein